MEMIKIINKIYMLKIRENRKRGTIEWKMGFT